MRIAVCLTMVLLAFLLGSLRASAGDVQAIDLDALVAEALNKSPELLVSETKVSASQYRIPQAKSLPDPMFMFGYQNEGFDKITIGEEPNAMGMFSLSQMFPFLGKERPERTDGGKGCGQLAGYAQGVAAQGRGDSQAILL